MSDEWVYNRDAETITSVNKLGRHRLVAIKVKPPDAEAILDLIGVALLVVTKPNPHPIEAPKRCACVYCRARRVLQRIGGEV